MSASTCSIFFHNYYGQHEEWVRFFSEKVNVPFNLFYNVVENSIHNLEEEAHLLNVIHNNRAGKFINKIILRKSYNQGKDIGGKLVLMDSLLHSSTESDYIIFLHDKRSPYKIQNEEWKKKLFRIIEPAFIQEALSAFKQNNQTGIIAGSESVNNEYDYILQTYKSNNKSQLEKLQTEFQINVRDHRYIAGAMFWARSLPLVDFFRKYHPLQIRSTLEKGNIMDEKEGTNTHAWERLLSWLVTAQGYSIKEL
jgi:lipopolysaccharide biosynthesis protein